MPSFRGALQGNHLCYNIIKIGELQQIDIEIFEFAVNEIAKVQGALLLTKTKVEMDIERAIFRCRVCGNEWEFGDRSKMGEDESEAIHFAPEVAHVYIRCPSCKSPDFEILRGRGVSIDYIKGKRD